MPTLTEILSGFHVREGGGDGTRVHELMCIMEAVLGLHGSSSHII